MDGGSMGNVVPIDSRREQRQLPPNRERDLMFFLLGAWVVQLVEKLLLLHK